jgi:hypothetical protein
VLSFDQAEQHPTKIWKPNFKIQNKTVLSYECLHTTGIKGQFPKLEQKPEIIN